MVAKKIITEEDKQEIIRQYNKSPNLSRIAKEFGTDYKRIKIIIKESGIKLKREVNSFTPDLEERAIILFKEGVFIKDISTELKVCRQLITQAIKKHKLKSINNFKLRPIHTNPEFFNGLTKEQEQEIINLYNSGKTITFLAPIYGMSTATIFRLLKRNNIPKNSANCTKIPEKYEPEIISLYEKGKSIIGIGRECNVGEGVIRRILKKNNIEIRKSYVNEFRPKISLEEEQELIKFYQNGISSFDLALKYKLAQGYVIAILNKNKIPLRYAHGQRKLNRKLGKKRLSEKLEELQKHKILVKKKPTKVATVNFLQQENIVEKPELEIIDILKTDEEVKKQGFTFQNRELEEYFINHKININVRIDQFINLGVSEEHLEEYLIFIRNISEKGKLRKPDSTFINSLLFNKLNVQSFLQKIEGKLRHINYEE